MSPFQSPLSIAFNLALLPLAFVVLAGFAVYERLSPVQPSRRKA